jgi:hypothetical protein
MDEPVCNLPWIAPRTFTSAGTGEKFETLPVNHICGLPKGHLDNCHCVCGEWRDA